MVLFLLSVAEIADVLLQQTNIRVTGVMNSFNTVEKRELCFTISVCNK